MKQLSQAFLVLVIASMAIIIIRHPSDIARATFGLPHKSIAEGRLQDSIEDAKNKTTNMKQCTIMFPQKEAKLIAKFLAENSIFTNLSWMDTDGFWTKTCWAIISFPDDKEDKVKANLQKWIKE